MILTKLCEHYDFLLEKKPDEIPSVGFEVSNNIKYFLVLDSLGNLVNIIPNYVREGNRDVCKPHIIPTRITRRQHTRPHFLCDDTQYVLGLPRPKGVDENGVVSDAEERIREERCEAFLNLHEDLFKGLDNPLVNAMLIFLRNWNPDDFKTLEMDRVIREDMKNVQGLVGFLLRDNNEMLMDYKEVKDAWVTYLYDVEWADNKEKQCLITGKHGKATRLHNRILGAGGRSTGVNLISFDKPSFRFQGKSQGDNAPISIEAMHKYTVALNHLLDYNNNNSIRINEQRIIFWARTEAATGLINSFFRPPDDESELKKFYEYMEHVSQGRPLNKWNPELEDSTEVYMLLLSPNSARLVIQGWGQWTLKELSERLTEHYNDMYLEPVPWKRPPSVFYLVRQTISDNKDSDSIDPTMTNDILNAIFGGWLYPNKMLTSTLLAIRSDRNVNGIRAAICKAVINRKHRKLVNYEKETIPMSLDKNEKGAGYLMGRLLSLAETIQRASRGSRAGSGVVGKFYSSASTTPAHTFPSILRNTQNHLIKLYKNKPGLAVNFEKALSEILEKVENFPKTLTLEEQGMFVVGFYHQTNESYRSVKRDDKVIEDGADRQLEPTNESYDPQ